MKKILVFPYNQPCLDISMNYKEGVKYGLNRDRDPDNGWSELRHTILSNAKEVILDEDLKIILLEDLAYTYGSNTDKLREKLIEFELI